MLHKKPWLEALSQIRQIQRGSSHENVKRLRSMSVQLPTKQGQVKLRMGTVGEGEMMVCIWTKSRIIDHLCHKIQVTWMK